jgi:hypothetical protein
MSYVEGLHPIISSDGFYDDLTNLNKFFMIVGSVILINVTRLELGWSSHFSEWSRQSVKSAPPCWGDVSCWRSSWWTWRSDPEAPPIFDDVAEVVPIVAIFPCIAVLGDASTCIILS